MSRNQVQIIVGGVRIRLSQWTLAVLLMLFVGLSQEGRSAGPDGDGCGSSLEDGAAPPANGSVYSGSTLRGSASPRPGLYRIIVHGPAAEHLAELEAFTHELTRSGGVLDRLGI